LKNAAQAQLDALSNANLTEGIRTTHRRKMLEAFLDFKGRDDAGSVLDVSDGPETGHPYYEYENLKSKNAVTICQVIAGQDGQTWQATYPNTQMAATTEKQRLPYQDSSFDWVYCNGVIEKSGSIDEQYALLEELWRVARKGVFLTTSNRKHFIEFNTGLPFLHWLPESMWKGVLNVAGKNDFRILRLLDAPMLEVIARRLPGCPQPEIGHVRFAVMKAHFFLMIRK
jgi:hypothetical protein